MSHRGQETSLAEAPSPAPPRPAHPPEAWSRGAPYRPRVGLHRPAPGPALPLPPCDLGGGDAQAARAAEAQGSGDDRQSNRTSAQPLTGTVSSRWVCDPFYRWGTSRPCGFSFYLDQRTLGGGAGKLCRDHRGETRL